jgi:FkbH-like protein
MSTNVYTELSWLARPPSNFSEQCKALTSTVSGETDRPLGARLQALASHSLNESQLNKLCNVIKKCVTADLPMHPLIPFRLGVLSNSTVDLIVPALVATAVRHGILLECIRANYNQVIQEALSADSLINSSRPDAVLIAIDHRALPLKSALGSAEAADEVVSNALGYLDSIRAGIETHNPRAVCIFPTFAPPPESLFGNLDRTVRGTVRDALGRINAGLAASLAGTTSILLDVAQIAETVGLAEWHSPEEWNLAKFPFSTKNLPLYADHVGRLIGALRGKSRKCLVLDLDNTVWGGIIGDDGLDGIHIAEGDATGEAHLTVQRMALALRERGVVLAVSSKNTDEIARLPFQKHPEMLLREEHIAVFQANWSDKATNIKAIAEELSLGIDSMVLLDDNPMERGLVRQILPQVAVPELPEDPALYARTLAAAGYFESINFSNEDTQRAGFYQDNARRITLQKKAGDVDSYLASLNMEISFQPFDATGRARIAQLINKSNQFNLTTRRYTEAEVAQVEQDPDSFTLQVRLTDSFGDNGMISVVICRKSAPAQWEVDTWLMSCRVLGRRVQDMVLKEILEHAKRRGIRKLVGVYIPSAKNALVKDHYAGLAFVAAATADDGSTRWELDVDMASVAAAPMIVHSTGFDLLERA